MPRPVPGPPDDSAAQGLACRACGRRVAVEPDCPLTRGVYPAAARDEVAREYLSGRVTYADLAKRLGCSKSTCWRWNRALPPRAEAWLRACGAQRVALGSPVGPLVLPEHKRELWRI